jgi:hypothetical protein
MNLTEQQYERVARRLDGQDLALSADEQAVCDEIAGDFGLLAPALAAPVRESQAGIRRAKVLFEIGLHEDAMGGFLDVDVPAEAMARAWRRTQAALARPQRRLLGVAAAAASVAAAAAVLLVMTIIADQPTRSTAVKVAAVPKAAPTSRASITEAYLASVSAAQDPVMNFLAAEIDQLDADVVASTLSTPPAPLDMDLDQTQKAIEEFWLDDVILE